MNGWQSCQRFLFGRPSATNASMQLQTLGNKIWWALGAAGALLLLLKSERPPLTTRKTPAGINNDPGKLLPAFRQKLEVLFARLRARGLDPLLYEGYRSPERAKQLSSEHCAPCQNAPSRTCCTGVYPSQHSIGAAADIVSVSKGFSAPKTFWDAIGKEAETIGLTWGGRFSRPDPGHVQAMRVADQATLAALAPDKRDAFVAQKLT